MSSPETIEQKIVRELRGEFIDDALERLDTMEQVINRSVDGAVGDVEGLSTIRREAHSIKGMGSSFGFPLITNVAHRLEDYLSGADALDQGTQSTVMLFVDVMREVVEDGENPDQTTSEIVLKKLPVRWVPFADQNRDKDWEIVLGVQSAVLRKIIGEKAAEMGCRVIGAQSPFEIIQLAAVSHPDALIVTAVMDGLWGADVVRALHAMEATSDIPVALLTSLKDSRIGTLPESTILIDEDQASLHEGLQKLCERIKSRPHADVRRFPAQAQMAG